MKTTTPAWIPALLAAGLGSGAGHAAVVVDWLTLQAGGTAGSFVLVADGGAPAASGALLIDAGKGTAFPPSNNAVNGSLWSASTGVTDSLTGNETVNALNFRVAPVAGAASYRIEIAVPAGREFVLAVGALYSGPLGKTDALTIDALSDGGPGSVSLLGTYSWNVGDVSSYDRDLDWTAATRTLSTTTGANGDSQIAFLTIPALAGANPRLVFTVPNGYASGTGDTITIGIGTVVPEPGAIGLAGLACVFMLAVRRR